MERGRPNLLGEADHEGDAGHARDAGRDRWWDPRRRHEHLSWVEHRLDELLHAPARGGERVPEAMRYAALGPGKRLRPMLALACTEAIGGDPWRTLDAACALEMVHAASLVLDDLPCMDDASLRRHRPTVHRVYGEDLAVLAAVGLLARAVHVVATDPRIPPTARGRLAGVIGQCVGCDGLVGGQEMDLRPDTLRVQCVDAEICNRRKTGVLFEAAAEVAAITCGVSRRTSLLIRRYGREFGCALQARDDLEDATQACAALGKDVRQDVGRRTLVELLGNEGARRRVDAHVGRSRRVVDLLRRTAGLERSGLLLDLLERAFGGIGDPPGRARTGPP